MSQIRRTCYFCGGPATTDDHIPPRVFFPEDKDLPPGTPPQRKNLLTVPACHLHNNSFSDDDEYAAFVICHSLENNEIGVVGVHTKAVRAAVRNKSKAFVMRGASRVEIDGQPSISFRPDVERLHRTFRRIARGLYFHLRGGEVLRSPLNVACIDMRYSSTLQRDPGFEVLSKTVGQFPHLFPEGNCPNPLTFRFQYAFPGPQVAMFILRFYDGFEVHVVTADGPAAVVDDQNPLPTAPNQEAD